MKRKDIEEHLETLWHLRENSESNVDNFISHTKEEINKDVIEKLEIEGYIVLNNEEITLTDSGKLQAMQIVRRHRLAERLLTDVLGMNPEDIEVGACEFEHILAPELTESICILLGHPQTCPHGIKIPPGECCRNRTESFKSAVKPLTAAQLNKAYTVAYINTGSDSRMNRLFNLQVMPGISIKVSQRYPAFVIHSGNTQLAVEENIAREIYVWKHEKE